MGGGGKDVTAANRRIGRIEYLCPGRLQDQGGQSRRKPPDNIPSLSLMDQPRQRGRRDIAEAQSCCQLVKSHQFDSVLSVRSSVLVFTALRVCAQVVEIKLHLLRGRAAPDLAISQTRYCLASPPSTGPFMYVYGMVCGNQIGGRQSESLCQRLAVRLTLFSRHCCRFVQGTSSTTIL